MFVGYGLTFWHVSQNLSRRVVHPSEQCVEGRNYPCRRWVLDRSSTPYVTFNMCFTAIPPSHPISSSRSLVLEETLVQISNLTTSSATVMFTTDGLASLATIFSTVLHPFTPHPHALWQEETSVNVFRLRQKVIPKLWE